MGDIVRKGTKDRPRFYIRYVDADGVRRQRAAKGATTKAQAQVILNAAELRVTQGRVGIETMTEEQQAQRTIAISELGELFTTGYSDESIKDRASYIRDAKSILKQRITPYLGSHAAATVDKNDIVEWKRKMADDKYTPASIMIAMATLSRIYTWARDAGHVACDNPLRGVKRPKLRRDFGELEYLQPAEVEKLLGHVEKNHPALLPFVATLCYCGLRKGEARGLRWRDVFLDAGRIEVCRSYTGRTKSGHSRTVPINPELMPILRRWKEENDGAELVFPINGRMGTREETEGLGEIIEAAIGRKPEHPTHALRHSFAAAFMMKGGSILTLQKLLGHSDIKVTMIYSHLSPDHMREEMARLSFNRPIAAVLPMHGHPKDTEVFVVESA
jgi:integrase